MWYGMPYRTNLVRHIILNSDAEGYHHQRIRAVMRWYLYLNNHVPRKASRVLIPDGAQFHP